MCGISKRGRHKNRDPYCPDVMSLKRDSNHLQLTGTLIGGIKSE